MRSTVDANVSLMGAKTGRGSLMEELVKSATRFCWATALFGAKVISDTLAPDEDVRAAGAFDSITRATEAQLSAPLQRTFRAVDRMQRGLVDATFEALTLESLTSRGMMRTTLNVVQNTAALIGQLGPRGETSAAMQELSNKLLVFNLFEGVDEVLHLPSETGVPLRALVERTRGLDPFLSVWATEGVGHFYAETAWGAGGEPKGLLRDERTRGVPSRCLAALHAGMGLSLANRLLAGVAHEPANCANGCELRGTLRRFVAMCRENSNDRYVGASYEALGLVARNLYPHFIPCVDRLLSEMSEDLVQFFWHGVGRAIYFAPSNYLPLVGSSRRAVEMAGREAFDEHGRRNALSGVAWALLLVNLRHPETIETILKQCESCVYDEEAFKNGVNSAAMIWRDSTVVDEHLEGLLRHRPDANDAHLVDRWHDLIKEPCQRALSVHYGEFKSRRGIGEAFRFQALA